MMLLILIYFSLVVCSVPSFPSKGYEIQGIDGINKENYLHFPCFRKNKAAYASSKMTFPTRFTFMMWIKHTPCTTENHLREIIGVLTESFLWEFDLKNNRYTIRVYNTTTSNTLDKMLLPIVLNKWLYLTLVKGAEGFKLMLYGDQVMMETPNIIITNDIKNHLYFLYDSENQYNNFNGYLFNLNIVGKDLSLQHIKEIYQSRNAFQPAHFFLPKLQPANSPFTDMSSKLLLSLGSSLKDISIKHIIQKMGPFYGVDSFSYPKFPLFEGKSYIKFKNFHIKQYQSICVSLWFKFIKMKNSPLIQTIVLLKDQFNLQYVRNTDWDNFHNASSQVVLFQSSTRTSVSVSVPSQSGVWLQVLGILNSNTSEIILHVFGYSKASVVTSLHFPAISPNNLVLGYNFDGSMFTGMLREFILFSNDSGHEYPGLFSLYKQSKLYDTLYYSKLLDPFNDTETSNLFLVYPKSKHSFERLNVKWKSDPENMILCPENMILEFDFPNQKVKCKESYVVIIKISENQPGLSLEPPTSSWTTAGSVCLKLLFLLTATFGTEQLFSYGDFNVSWSHNNTLKHSIFNIQHGLTQLFSATTSFKPFHWNSVCFGFSAVVPGTSYQFLISSAFDKTWQTSGTIPSLPFGNSGRLEILSTHSSNNIAIKQVLVLNQLISKQEHFVYFALHPEFLSSLGSKVLAWWPLNDTGDFVDPIIGTVSQRINNGQSGGISQFVVNIDELGSHISSPGKSFLEDTNSYYPIQTYFGSSLPRPIIKLSVDFSDLVYFPWIRSHFPTQSKVQMKIGGKAYRPDNSFFSKYHGLVIQNPGYESYIASVQTEINIGWVSLWFYKKDTTDKVLLSGYGGSGNSNQFSFVVGNTFSVIDPDGATSVSGAPVLNKKWYHFFGRWEISSLIETTFCLNGGVAHYLSGFASSFSAVSDAKIILGIQLDSLGSPISSSIFEGYIRRVELIDTEVYPSLSISEFQVILPNLARKFITTNGCDSQYAPCLECDIFTKTCFTLASHLRLPDDSANCPSECAVLNFTSCDSSSKCSGCAIFGCLDCWNSRCTRCFGDLIPDDNGNCGCPEGSVVNSSTLQCESCHPSCLTCASPNDQNQCTTCPGTSFFTLGPNVGLCLNSCPSGYVSKNSICVIKCHSSCKTCSVGDDQSKCLSCSSKYHYLLGNAPTICISMCPKNSVLVDSHCQYCDQSCADCAFPANASACFSCFNSSYFLHYPAESLKIGSCLENCSGTGTFEDRVNMKCHSCPINTFQNNKTQQCLPCHDSCFSCAESNNPLKCTGCSSKYPYLRLSSKNENSGKCDTSCGKNEDKLSKFICIPYTKYWISVAQAKNWGNPLNWLCVISVILCAGVSAITVGSFNYLFLTLGNIQILVLFTLVRAGSVPEQLEAFYSRLSVTSFDFLPNIMLLFHDTGSESRYFHPSLHGELFLVNIGSLLFLLFLYGAFVFIIQILSPTFSFANRLAQCKIKMLNELGLFAFCPIWLASIVQLAHGKYSAETFFVISTISGIVGMLACLLYSGFVFFRLRREREHLSQLDISNNISCFYEHYKRESIAFFSIISFLGSRLIVVFLLVVFDSNVYVQIATLLTFNGCSLALEIYLRPYIQRKLLILSLVHYFAQTIVSFLYFGLSLATLTGQTQKLLVFWIMLLVSVCIGMAIIVEFWTLAEQISLSLNQRIQVIRYSQNSIKNDNDSHSYVD